MNSVPGDYRKHFLRDGEDASTRFARKPIVKDTGFKRPGSVALKDYPRPDLFQILQRRAHRSDNFDAIATLADIRLQNKWKLDFMFATNPVQGKQAIRRSPALNQVRVRDKLRIRPLKLLKNFAFRFANKSACGNSGVCRSRNAETAITNCEPQTVTSHGKVKQPRRPKLPVRPAPNKSWRL